MWAVTCEFEEEKHMIRKIGLITFILLVVAGCGPQLASVTTTPPSVAQLATITPAASSAAANPASTGTLSEQAALALADKFYGLFVEQQDYTGAIDLFDAQMIAALPESKLKELWETLPQQVGSFKNRADAHLADRKDPYQRVIIPLQFEKMALDMLVVVDMTTGQISGLFFQPVQ
jgi:hypothetical protein